jgi:hypothetical protein
MDNLVMVGCLAKRLLLRNIKKVNKKAYSLSFVIIQHLNQEKLITVYDDCLGQK